MSRQAPKTSSEPRKQRVIVRIQLDKRNDQDRLVKFIKMPYLIRTAFWLNAKCFLVRTSDVSMEPVV